MPTGAGGVGSSNEVKFLVTDVMFHNGNPDVISGTTRDGMKVDLHLPRDGVATYMIYEGREGKHEIDALGRKMLTAAHAVMTRTQSALFSPYQCLKEGTGDRKSVVCDNMIHPLGDYETIILRDKNVDGSVDTVSCVIWDPFLGIVVGSGIRPSDVKGAQELFRNTPLSKPRSLY